MTALAPLSRSLACTRCGTLIAVYEAPAGCVDAATFVCATHLRPVRMLEPVRDPVPYDPATAEIPF